MPQKKVLTFRTSYLQINDLTVVYFGSPHIGYICTYVFWLSIPNMYVETAYGIQTSDNIRDRDVIILFIDQAHQYRPIFGEEQS